MLDPATISAALGSANAILNLLKGANDGQLAYQITNEVAQVQGKLIELQQQTLSLQSENQKLRAEMDEARACRFHHSVNWRILPDGSEDGPFCPVCAGENVVMRLTLRAHIDQTGPILHLQCPKPHKVGMGVEGFRGQGREISYGIPKELLAENRYFVHA